METTRDIVIIIFGITGVMASVVLVIMSIKIYGRTCEALERVGRASEDIHVVAEGVRSGVSLAKGALEVVGPVLPGLGWIRSTYRAAKTIHRVTKLFSRLRRTEAAKDE